MAGIGTKAMELAVNRNDNVVLPSAGQTKGMQRRCPRNCYKTCRLKHHPLLLALINATEAADIRPLTDLINFYIPEFMAIDDPIPDVKHGYQHSLLHWSAALGLTSLVRWLLSQGASCTQAQPNTPLHIAFIELPVHCRDQPSQTFKNLLPLLWPAVFHCDFYMKTTVMHQCALMIAMAYPTIDYNISCFHAIVEHAMLLSPDGSLLNNLLQSLDQQGQSPLHILTKSSRDPRVPALLLNLLQNPLSKPSFLFSSRQLHAPLFYIMTRFSDIWRLKFFAEFATTHVLSSDQLGRVKFEMMHQVMPPAGSVLMATFKEDLNQIKAFIQSSSPEVVDACLPDSYKGTCMPLVHWAAAVGSTKILNCLCLLLKKPNWNPPTVNRTPLHTSLVHLPLFYDRDSTCGIFKEILPYFTSLLTEVDSDGDMPFHKCAKNLMTMKVGQPLVLFYNAALFLMFKCLEPEGQRSVWNHSSNNGDTLLHLLVQCDCVGMHVVGEGLKSGANVHAMNEEGKTPLQLHHSRFNNLMEFIQKLPSSANFQTSVTIQGLKNVGNKDIIISEDEEENDPAISVECNGSRFNLVGDNDIINFLENIRAPSPTFDHIVNVLRGERNRLADELRNTTFKMKETQQSLDAQFERQSIEAKIRILDEKGKELLHQEQRLCAGIERLQLEISSKLKTLDSLKTQLKESTKSHPKPHPPADPITSIFI